MTQVLGIDLGGSSIKAGAVDVASGRVLGDTQSIPITPPAAPDEVARAVASVAQRFPSSGPIGFAYPGVVTAGVARSAANVAKAWLGLDGAALVREATGRSAWFLNDADAAGLAEMRIGAGRGERGVVMMLTFGTGIGSALFVDGRLWPNTELGHLEVGGAEAEAQASARVRSELALDWPAWCARVNGVLAAYHALFWPDLFIIGGGVSDRFEEFGGLLRAPARIVPAALRHQAGVVGAAFYAAECEAQRTASGQR